MFREERECERERECVCPLVPPARSGLSLVSASNFVHRHSMEQCRFGSACLRPLCPHVHADKRARRWAELRKLPPEQEDAPVMQIILQERITEKKAVEQAEQTVDITVPQNYG